MLLIYSAIGAFDYANGLTTQWLHPLPEEIAASALVLTALTATLIFQIVVVYLLFKDKAIHYFLNMYSEESK